MNLRQLLLAVAAVAAIGVLAYLVRMTQSVDGGLHLQRLASIRAIDALDVEFNRSFTQSQGSSTLTADAAGSERSSITGKLGSALDAIDKGPASLRGLNPEIDRALQTVLDTIEDKFELGYDYEARNILLNQRLIASLDAVSLRGAQAAVAAADARLAPEALETLNTLLSQVRNEMLNYAVAPTPTGAALMKDLEGQLKQASENQPEALAGALAQMRDSLGEALTDKGELVERVNALLDTPTGPQLRALEQAYIAWNQAQVAVANQYRLYLAAYAVLLLLVLGLLGLRLRRSYRELDKANDELSHSNERLEQQVEARTHDLSAALQDLRASQAQLIQSEKMAALGQMVAGVAHEINTPLGYARSNTEIVRTSLADIRSLCAAQSRALGLMSAEGASDEDVAEALGTAQALSESINAEELAGDLDGLLADADHGLLQVAELVAGLKDFSRVDRSRNDLFNVNDGLDAALKICQNTFKHRVEVVKNYGTLPQIECSPSQLNQVFLNLFNNAAQAIEGTGRIYVHTSNEAHGVAIRVLDTGSGMSEEVRARIFEPFFTTKPVGKGTGLGLSIVFRIIEDHGGRIEVRSTPGKGSEFVIRLPLKQAPRTEETAAAPAAAMAA